MLDHIKPIRRMAFAALMLIAGLITIAPITSTNAAELIMLEEDGCPWCELWRKEVGVIYAKTDEGKIAPVREVDINDPLPDDLKFLTKGKYTPTFILIENGKEYGRIRGYPGESFFWGLLAVLIERLPKTDKSS